MYPLGANKCTLKGVPFKGVCPQWQLLFFIFSENDDNDDHDDDDDDDEWICEELADRSRDHGKWPAFSRSLCFCVSYGQVPSPKYLLINTWKFHISKSERCSSPLNRTSRETHRALRKQNGGNLQQRRHVMMNCAAGC